MYTNIKHKFSKDLVPSILPLFKKKKAYYFLYIFYKGLKRNRQK